MLGGIWMLRARRNDAVEPVWLATLFACASTYIIVTGIVYNLLLRSIPIAGISDVWTNETLHVVIPLVLLADAFLAPRRRFLPWRTIGMVVMFPILWAVYTMFRANLVTGPATGDPWWYPYPFLDPHLVAIALVITAVAAGVLWIGRRRSRDDSQPRSAEPAG